MYFKITGNTPIVAQKWKNTSKQKAKAKQEKSQTKWQETMQRVMNILSQVGTMMNTKTKKKKPPHSKIITMTVTQMLRKSPKKNLLKQWCKGTRLYTARVVRQNNQTPHKNFVQYYHLKFARI